MKKHMRRWGAVYILVALFLVSWVFQFYNQLDQISQEAATHGEEFLWADFWPQFLAATFENWQSEFLQLAVQAFLIGSYIQEKVFKADYTADKADVQSIEGKLDALLQRK